jgi:hypothetical protein
MLRQLRRLPESFPWHTVSSSSSFSQRFQLFGRLMRERQHSEYMQRLFHVPFLSFEFILLVPTGTRPPMSVWSLPWTFSALFLEETEVLFLLC